MQNEEQGHLDICIGCKQQMRPFEEHKCTVDIYPLIDHFDQNGKPIYESLESMQRRRGINPLERAYGYVPDPRMVYLCPYCNAQVRLVDTDVVVDSYKNVCCLACLDKNCKP